MFRGRRDHFRCAKGLIRAEVKEKKKSQSSSRMARSYNTLGKEWEVRLKRLRVNVEDPEYWDKIWVHPAANGRCVYVCVGVYMCNCH